MSDYKPTWRDLACTQCMTVQGFTLASVTCYKNYYCHKCQKFTEMEFTGDTYARNGKMQRIQDVLEFEPA